MKHCALGHLLPDECWCDEVDDSADDGQIEPEQDCGEGEPDDE